MFSGLKVNIRRTAGPNRATFGAEAPALHPRESSPDVPQSRHRPSFHALVLAQSNSQPALPRVGRNPRNSLSRSRRMTPGTHWHNQPASRQKERPARPYGPAELHGQHRHIAWIRSQTRPKNAFERTKRTYFMKKFIKIPPFPSDSPSRTRRLSAPNRAIASARNRLTDNDINRMLC